MTPQILAHQIECIDTGYVRKGFAASYLIHDGQYAAFFETGHPRAVPRLLQALKKHHILPENVLWVVVSHVHLDHAGGSAGLLAHLPNATLYVHPRGVPHMVDPNRLLQGVMAVYGEKQFNDLFGPMDGIAVHRVQATEDGMILSLGKRRLQIWHTPGHALHHLCLWEHASGVLFTGDTMGISYRALDHAGRFVALPATTPSQFDPQAMQTTLRQLAKLKPSFLYLTHFSVIPFQSKWLDGLARNIDLFAQCMPTHAGQKNKLAQQLLAIMMASHPMDLGLAKDWLAMDIQLNAEGLQLWWERVK